MDSRIANELAREEQTEFHAKMLEHCKSLIKLSRDERGKYYNDWDNYDEIYRGIRQPDEQDKKATERKEPIKMVVPLTRSQVDTAIAFCMSLFNQRPNFYELSGTGAEDHKSAKIAEAVIKRDLDENQWEVKEFQFLLDIFKFGQGILKHSWVRETQRVPVTQTIQPTGLFGLFQNPREVTSVQEQTAYLGNRIYNISPYRFFPDVRLPLSRFQEGEFCASEDEVSRVECLQREKQGDYAGVKHIKGWTKEVWDSRKGNSRLPYSGLSDSATSALRSQSESGRAITLTECQVKIVPDEFTLGDSKPLGDEKYPIKYVVVYANDQRIVKCEPIGYIHDKFTYDVAEMNPDMHHLTNGGLSEAIDELQSTISWLINSHITSIRKVIQNRLVVDPDAINMDDLNDRNPVIRMRKGTAARAGIDRIIKQLDVQDVTQNNVKDATVLGELIELVTGVNQNAQGQYSKGRRSAEQTRAVNAGASTRLRVVATLIWVSALHPQGKKLLSNLRDGLDEETFVKVVGLKTTQPNAPEAVNIQDFVQSFKVTKTDLVGAYDFETLDGTLPSEKNMLAMFWQEILTAIIANPQAAAIFGYNPRALLQEIAELRGARNPDRFFVQPTLPAGGLEQMQMVLQQQQMQQQAAQQAQQAQQGAPGQNGNGSGSANPRMSVQDIPLEV